MLVRRHQHVSRKIGVSSPLYGKKVYIPAMAQGSVEAFASVFRLLGVEAYPTPPSNDRTLELGARYTAGDECFPAKVTVGDFLRIIEQPGFQPDRAIFFMATADGPCRFGQYAPFLRKLRVQYGANIIPMDFLPLDEEDISEVNANMYWNSGRRILAAARITRRNRNLHLVYVTNFKCGPDSYIKSFLNDASGKPGLVLQFDGHSNDAGFITRCEAYLDSKGFLRCSPSATSM